MKTFREYITELFDKPYKTKLEKSFSKDRNGNHFYYAEFQASNGQWVEVQFDKVLIKNKDAYELTFTRGRTFSMTGDGDAYRILATVIQLCIEFIKKEQPDILEFTADKLLDGNSESRAKLYSALMKRYASKVNYKTSEKKLSSDVILFRFIKK